MKTKVTADKFVSPTCHSPESGDFYQNTVSGIIYIMVRWYFNGTFFYMLINTTTGRGYAGVTKSPEDAFGSGFTEFTHLKSVHITESN